ncbi:MAG TPA: adenylate/guanylate cyclase domain-containing protein [Candidatus Wallbacteria bacterium]|nr:MAG: Adenylate and Guanylate cyclase catalytic domain protein [bacterium ADurb.Bin243]HOD39178.1 adenylate/guanylate cyclase domain-containing protein [Candidatus Wallbacteria bacterium]HPG56194.1 adenylate/guanylate cyclase domain-containing protein [Candidatus Wallbacteria bacterium]
MMPAGLKSQNLSIMMTDIQGYTNASSSSSREEIVGLIRRHNQLMIPVITFYGGTIVKSIGDAFLCTFTSATDAVVCSIIIQLLLREYNKKQKEEAKKMMLRVVINTGDVSIEKNDIYGDAVNITSRMEGLDCFPGGTIGISESTYLLMNRNEIVTEKLGPQTLKGIPDPVNVYKIPLEKQKLTEIPSKLLQLVEKSFEKGASSSAGSGSAISSAQFNEWNNAVVGFLKEKNWGENIGSLLDEKKIRENVTMVQKQLTATFSQKTVIESKGKDDFNDATMESRIKSGVIDAVIFTVAWLIIYYAVWWPVQSIVFGGQYIGKEDYKILSESKLKGLKGDQYEAVYESLRRDYPQKYVGREFVFVRPRGLLESLISINMEYPFILMAIYLAFFWIIRGASPGQIATRTAVVKDDGSPVDIVTAVKRSFIFVASVMFFFIGVLMIFTESKKTLYDKMCNTRVVE